MSFKLKMLNYIFFGFSAFNAHALSQSNLTITFVGSQSIGPNAAMTYVYLSANPDGCLYSGIYYTDEALRKDALITALAAKAFNRVVRMDYTKNPDGMCIGSGIYVQ
jgi:hypothetical protein